MISAFEDTTHLEQETVMDEQICGSQLAAHTPPDLHENSTQHGPRLTVPGDPMEGSSREIYSRVHAKRPISPAD